MKLPLCCLPAPENEATNWILMLFLAISIQYQVDNTTINASEVLIIICISKNKCITVMIQCFDRYIFCYFTTEKKNYTYWLKHGHVILT